MAHLYEEIARVEHGRENRDMMYRLIVDTKTDILQSLCEAIVSHLLQKYGKDPKKGCSVRLQKMLKKTLKDESRVAKHGLLMFALFQEPEVVAMITRDTTRIPPEKFQRFIQHDLPTLSNQLLTGSFTSMQAYVEDARWAYVSN